MPDSILATIRYFDLFDQPLTATQLWQWQVGATTAHPLHEIQEAAVAAVAAGALETSAGYFFLPGREELVSTWLCRHSLAQQKWKLTRRIVYFLQYVPFVKMIAMSGSLAIGNTRSSSDLDLLVIVEAKRMWLARGGLLFITAVLGRRRRHWDRQAPDKICLNHYLTDTTLTIASDIQNLYTAILYRSLITLSGEDWHQKFRAANRGWMQTYAVVPPTPAELPPRQLLSRSRFITALQQGVESIAREAVWDWFESVASSVQRWVITRHTEPGRPGRVVINKHELAFHPDSKVPALLNRYYGGARF